MHFIKCGHCGNSSTFDPRQIRSFPGTSSRSSLIEKRELSIRCLWCHILLKIELKDEKPALST
jgi:hypothetical protein